MKVEVNEAKLKSFELALQNYEVGRSLDKLLEQSETIYKYIF